MNRVIRDLTFKKNRLKLNLMLNEWSLNSVLDSSFSNYFLIFVNGIPTLLIRVHYLTCTTIIQYMQQNRKGRIIHIEKVNLKGLLILKYSNFDRILIYTPIQKKFKNT